MECYRRLRRSYWLDSRVQTLTIRRHKCTTAYIFGRKTTVKAGNNREEDARNINSKSRLIWEINRSRSIWRGFKGGGIVYLGLTCYCLPSRSSSILKCASENLRLLYKKKRMRTFSDSQKEIFKINCGMLRGTQWTSARQHRKLALDITTQWRREKRNGWSLGSCMLLKGLCSAKNSSGLSNRSHEKLSEKMAAQILTRWLVKPWACTGRDSMDLAQKEPKRYHLKSYLTSSNSTEDVDSAKGLKKLLLQEKHVCSRVT